MIFSLSSGIDPFLSPEIYAFPNPQSFSNFEIGIFRYLHIDFTRSTVFIDNPPNIFREIPKNRVDKLENTLYNEFRI